MQDDVSVEWSGVEGVRFSHEMRAARPPRAPVARAQRQRQLAQARALRVLVAAQHEHDAAQRQRPRLRPQPTIYAETTNTTTTTERSARGFVPVMLFLKTSRCCNISISKISFLAHLYIALHVTFVCLEFQIVGRNS